MPKSSAPVKLAVGWAATHRQSPASCVVTLAPGRISWTTEQPAGNVRVGDTVFAETYWDGSAAHFLIEDNGVTVIS